MAAASTCEREQQVSDNVKLSSASAHSQALAGTGSICRRHSRIERYLPSVLGGLLYLSAFISGLLFVVRTATGPFVQVVDNSVTILSFLGMPVASSLFNAVVVAVTGAAALRRKRAVVWIALGFQTLVLFANVAVFMLQPDDIQPYRNVYLFAAMFNVAFLVILWWGRHAFPGTIGKGSLLGGLVILIGGMFGTFATGFLATKMAHPAASSRRIVAWIIYRLVGAEFFTLWSEPVVFGSSWIGAMVSIMGAVTVVAALIYFWRGYRPVGSTREEDLRVRRLLIDYPGDSLGYYATRSERSVVFSPNGKAAVSYALSSGAAIAAADPLGDPDSWDDAVKAWLDLCFRSGWAPGVLSVSEQGARAYKRAGFQIHAMGDEAIIHTGSFDLSAPQMRGLNQSVRRARRHGIRIEVRRLDQISDDELKELRKAAVVYRDGPERGFTMSLDRIMEDEDGRTMVVTARDDNQIHAILTFVPWGAHGLSLNLMRRNRASVNGIIEAMVVYLIEQSKDTAITHISMNFAMFRGAFVAGEAVNANIFRRFFRAMMRLGSKVWQLESLYESNARYQPQWFPRYMGVRHSSQTASVLIGAGRLEGFIPDWGLRQPPGRSWQVDDDFISVVRAMEEPDVSEIMGRQHLSEQEQIRRRKADTLMSIGRHPYPAAIAPGTSLSSVRAQAETAEPGILHSDEVVTSGRIRAWRDMGGLVFADLYRDGERLQVIMDRSRLSLSDWADRKLLDLGDVITVTGHPGRSRLGEPSIMVSSWQIMAKSLRPWPPVTTVLDANTRVRQRTLHLAHSPDALELIRLRSRAVTSVRTCLGEAGYAEVETPILQAVKGGANARPFVTHMRAYSTDVFLRIAPELYLKRLAVAGMGAIFEVGRSFRNEGADATHNPEFTSLEAYKAGADYHDMRRLTQHLIQQAAEAVFGEQVCLRPASAPECAGKPVYRTLENVPMCAFDISGDWPVVPVLDAVSKAVGQKVTTETSAADLAHLCTMHGIEIPALAEPGELIGALYDELVEANTVQPTFYTDFPVSTSPLTRRSRTNPLLAERWDLVAFGMELGTAYTELTDPRDQRERFTQQSLAAAAGDPEAMSIDEDFLSALDLGLPPTGGMGMGIDRMVMLLTGTNIRQTLPFPFVRPHTN